MEKNAKHGVYTIDKSCLNCKFADWDSPIGLSIKLKSKSDLGFCVCLAPRAYSSRKEYKALISKKDPWEDCDTWQAEDN